MKVMVDLPVIHRSLVSTPTLALGLVCSVVAVAVVLTVQTTTSVPTVVAVGLLAAAAFALSWHQCGRPLSVEADEPPT